MYIVFVLYLRSYILLYFPLSLDMSKENCRPEQDLGLSLCRPGPVSAKNLRFWAGNLGSGRPKIGSWRPKS
jgi:hypothetical protein